MLLSDSFHACFTSLLARFRRTAEIFWADRDEDLILDSDLREIDLYSFQTPNSPVASGNSGGRKTSKRIILFCQGTTRNSAEISLAGMGYAPLNMLGIIRPIKGTHFHLSEEAIHMHSIIQNTAIHLPPPATHNSHTHSSTDPFITHPSSAIYNYNTHRPVSSELLHRRSFKMINHFKIVSALARGRSPSRRRSPLAGDATRLVLSRRREAARSHPPAGYALFLTLCLIVATDALALTTH
ncbi:hypothetical protein E2562_017088 [Oryza meyeriana var. granulata]|uniref:Uncharacterized protein n=1 Tax=Oryza meyeriana var. granulata TaxID=110450 RepID=A0A6G1F8X2_9ORYZ|nr:hypothetical protein E2562_017088 [Oryza meyeriana var. granulata]